MNKKPDYLVENHGTIFMFTPMNAKARKWLRAHVQEDAQWLGDSLAVEHRYARDLADNLTGDGFLVR